METGKGKNRLVFLDAARGFAVLLVLIQHGFGLGSREFSKWTSENADIGRIGVLIFLCISGFIIPQSLDEGGFNLRFWIRRFFRLYPAYWVAVIFAYIYASFGGPGLTAPADKTTVWLINLTMFQGFLNLPHVMHIFWTLHLEMVIYLTFWCLNGLGLLKKPGWFLATLIVGYLAWAIIIGKVYRQPLVLSEYFNYFAALLGFAAQAVFLGKISSKWGAALMTGLIISPLCVYICNLLNMSVYDGNFWLNYYTTNFLLAYGVFLVFFALRSLTPPWGLVHIGRISYSIYLSHPVILWVCFLLGYRGWPLFGLMSGVSILVSELLFQLVEMPSIAFGKTIADWAFPKKQEKFTSNTPGMPSPLSEKNAA